MRGRGAHDPARPRLALLMPVADNAPKFIRDAVERATWIYTHPERFPELTKQALAPGARVRPRRTSRLEAVALTIAALCRRCDIRTFRVGDQRWDDLCNGVSVSELRRATGLTPSRQWRALREVREAGYFASVKQPVVAIAPRSNLRRRRRGAHPIQRYAGLPAVRTMAPLLFRRLRYTAAKIEKARTRAGNVWRAAHAPVASPIALQGLRAARRELNTGYPRSPNVQPPPVGSAGAWLVASVRDANPDWSDEQVAAEAARLLRPPPRTH